MTREIQQILPMFTPVSLEEMNKVALLHRTETKFVISELQLLDIVATLAQEYKVLSIDGKSLMTYTSLYFDTPNFRLYREHHNGKLKRTKIRIRKYVDSEAVYLEVKKKDGRGNTHKIRIPMDDFETTLSQSALDFIANSTSQREIQWVPSLWNTFNRITLVDHQYEERVTIDMNLSYQFNDRVKTIDKLAVIEVKQKRLDRCSPIMLLLKKRIINPYKLSKYCIGMLYMHPKLKHNLFKEKLIKINKIKSA